MAITYYIIKLPDRETLPTMFLTFDIFAGGCAINTQMVLYADTDLFADQISTTLKKSSYRHCKVSSIDDTHSATENIDNFTKHFLPGPGIPLLIWSKKEVPQNLQVGGLAFMEVPRDRNGGLDSAFFHNFAASVQAKHAYCIATTEEELVLWSSLDIAEMLVYG
uniref:Uncharacterized protein n=1 Tax=Ditylenchus dipsaci TaxID=166011 RepID=A0A915E5U3_9BILA